jgi:serine/threonine protein kinase
MSAIVCATGTSPFTASAASGGYFGLVQKVINEPSPVLTPAQGFSADFCDWIAKALIKDPAQRWTAEQLLAHPFLAAPDAGIDSKSWPPPFSSERVALNDADMDSVIQATAQYYYLRPGCPPYKGSLFEQARFERIGQQFGVDTRRVKKQFEAYLKTQQLTSGMGSLSIKE